MVNTEVMKVKDGLTRLTLHFARLMFANFVVFYQRVKKFAKFSHYQSFPLYGTPQSQGDNYSNNMEQFQAFATR